MGTGLVFGILGPLEVRAGGTLVHVGGPRQRALLALLLCHANRVVSRDELIEELLAGQPPRDAARMLRVRISRLRQALADGDSPGRLVARPPGYVLRVEPGELDLQVFEQRVAAGRVALARGDSSQAAVLLAEAESLWRGRPLADLEFESFARFEIQRLEADRLAAAEDRIEAQLALGHHSTMCPELEQLVAEHPLRERLRGQLMVALYRSGRQAEALETYRAGRSLLVAELGIEPGPGLRRLHEQVLAADPGLGAPALPAGILAGRPALAVPRELPADVAAFTGRAAELAGLDLLLPGSADQDGGGGLGAVVISAVAGTAGVGKTTLAVRWAHRAAGQFPDGQLYVNLRGYDPGQLVTPGEALAGFLRALGVADADVPLREAERAARYRSVAAGKRLLVVLDNAATVAQVRPLLPGTGTAMVVVTSRDSLAGLVARDGAHRLDLDLLPQGEAVALLRTLIGPRVDADPAAAETLAGLCARLPLALRVAAELATAQPGRPLAELVAELAGESSRLELLEAGGDPRGAVASVFSWSYQHLPAEAARMFRLLGLHPAQHWDPHAAAALTATTSLSQARRTLAQLARAHLIQPAAPGRYQMHDLLRAYAASLAGSHDSDQARQAALTGLFDFYLAACAAAMDRLAPAEHDQRPAPPAISTPVPAFGDRAAARCWLDAGLNTLTQVATHTAGHGWPGHTVRLASTLYRYLYSSHDTEALSIHARGLHAARQLGDRAGEARMLGNLGYAHDRQGRYQQAADCHQQALTLADETGDGFARAWALNGLAIVRWRLGHYQPAFDGYQQALALFRELGDKVGEARELVNLGEVCFIQGQYQPAADYAQQSLELALGVDDQFTALAALLLAGKVCCQQGRYTQAGDHLQSVIAQSRENGYRLHQAEALASLGEVRHRQGHYDQATRHHQQALALYRELANPSGEADALYHLGQALLATGQPGQAHACHTTALTLARQTGHRHQQARALTGLGEVRRWQGDHDQAISHHQQALALYRELGDCGGQAEALNAAGETLLASGQPGQARDCFAAALALSRRIGYRYQHARAHYGLAATYKATGDTSKAGQHRRHALNINTGLGVPEATHIHASPRPGPN